MFVPIDALSKKSIGDWISEQVFINIMEDGNIFKSDTVDPNSIKYFEKEFLNTDRIVTLRFIKNLNKFNLSLFEGIKCYNTAMFNLIDANRYFLINDEYIVFLNEKTDIQKVTKILKDSDNFFYFIKELNRSSYLVYYYNRKDNPNLLVVVNEQQIYQDILKDLEGL